MKKIAFLSALLFASVVSASAVEALPSDSAKKDTLRVLCIGNSFSVDAVEQNFGEIAAADGQPVIVGNLYIGGCPLEKHWNNMFYDTPAYSYRKRVGCEPLQTRPSTTLAYGLADEQWDVVTLQQRSGWSGLWMSYEPYLGDLVRYVRASCKEGVRVMWHETWSYENESLHEDFKNYGCNSFQMFSAIADASRKACGKYSLEVIPTGAAIMNIRTTYIGANTTRDGFHLNHTIGRYTAAASFYAAISRKPVSGNTFRTSHLFEERWKIAQMAVDSALVHPFEMTVLREFSPKVFRGQCTTKDEADVPSYVLPDALVASDGSRIRTARQWESRRRAEIFSVFESQMYGKAPGRPSDLRFEVVGEDSSALGGLATRKLVRISYASDPKAYFTLLEYLPNSASGPVPMFLSLNFAGNYGITTDPGVPLYTTAEKNRIGVGSFLGERGYKSYRYPLEAILSAGYGFATVYHGEIATDSDTSCERGPFRYFYEKGQWHPKADEWGEIAAWAWGLSRCLDYLETDSSVNASKVAVMGHSRQGKAALWAAAADQRFAMCISNDSGCCGAAISRRVFGENFKAIDSHFPHWFCENFHQWQGREAEFPVDQHELLALVAPRPLYVASATEDLWADPVGEGIALEEAKKVYALYGKKALKRLGRHIRSGKHDITAEDWAHYIRFADQHLK